MDPAAIIHEYTELRAVSVRLHTRLAQMLDPRDFGAAATALGMLHGKHVDLETEDEINVLMDYAIYDVRRDGRNAVDRLLEKEPPPVGSVELRLLRSMQNSTYTIFETEAAIPGLGVLGFAGPEREPILLVDIGFSQTALPGLVLATRIHSPEMGWWMTTGAALPLNKEAVDAIVRELAEHVRRYGSEPAEQERTRLIIRSCIASGASRQIAYASAGASVLPDAVAPVRRSAKVGRNDPCPCGSGRKHKKCCGG